MVPDPSSRRRFLSVVGTAATTVIAGCGGLEESRHSPGTDADSEWPLPGYDTGSSAWNPDAAGPRKGVTERWRTEIDRPSDRPVVASGAVFVPTWRGLVALDLDSGEEKWRVGTDQPWPVAPAVHDGSVYVGHRDETGFVALDASDGSEQWRFETRGDVSAPPTFDYDFRWLYVGDDTGRVYQVNPTNGAVEHATEVVGAVSALASRTSLLVGTEGGEVYDLYEHRDTLTPLWRRKVAGGVTDVALVDTTIAVATFGGPLYRLQDGLHAGTSRWEYERGAIHLAATPYDVFGTDMADLQAVHYRTGEKQWNVGGSFDCGPAVAGDTLYVGGSRKDGRGGFVAGYALNGGPRRFGFPFGGTRWRHEVDSAVGEGIAVADGAVFAVTYGDGDRNVPPRAYALDAA